MKTKGLHPYRFKDNPEEKKFAEAWARLNERHPTGSSTTLDQLLDSDHHTTCSPRDEQVAATVIQWLGSPVGQNWLVQLGYEKTRRRAPWPTKRRSTPSSPTRTGSATTSRSTKTKSKRS